MNRLRDYQTSKDAMERAVKYFAEVTVRIGVICEVARCDLQEAVKNKDPAMDLNSYRLVALARGVSLDSQEASLGLASLGAAQLTPDETKAKDLPGLIKFVTGDLSESFFRIQT